MNYLRIIQLILVSLFLICGITGAIYTLNLEILGISIVAAIIVFILLTPSFNNFIWNMIIMLVISSFIKSYLEELEKNGKPLPTAQHLKAQINNYLSFFKSIQNASSDAMIDKIFENFFNRRE